MRPFNPDIDGHWPEHCEQRAFVAGAKWWEFHKSGATMWGDDADKAETEAIARYGDPLQPPPPHAPAPPTVNPPLETQQ